MRISLALFAASTLSGADAFVPNFRQRAVFFTPTAQLMAEDKSAALDVGLGEITLTYKPEPEYPQLPQVIQGVQLPDNMVPKPLPNEFVTDLVTKVFAPSILMNINQNLKPNPLQSKKGPLTVVQEIMIKTNEYKVDFNILAATKPNLAILANLVNEYKFFGNGNHVKSLAELLKNNPFWASALVATDDGGFELNAYNPEGSSTRYQKMIATLDSSGRKVNIKFDKNMDLKSFEVFDDVEESVMLASGDASSKEADKWASSAMYNMLFYASCQHAIIHTFHYLLTSAFQYVATEHDKKSKELSGMKAWADTYASNIQDKYQQVSQLLINDTPPIPPTVALDASVGTAVVGGTYAIITGPLGFGSNQDIRPLLHDMLMEWGGCTSAKDWMDVMYTDLTSSTEGYKNPKASDGAVLLQEFSKHLNIIPEFAKEMSQVLKKEPFADEAEDELAQYLNMSGDFLSKIETFESWTEVMAVTGMVHGSTLSYTRAIADWEILRWRNIDSDNWDTGDMNILFGGLGTIVGMQLDRHVMGGGKFFPKGENESVKRIREVLETYDKKVSGIKWEYLVGLIQKPEFLDYGWIWTDFCPDGFDGKQLTMATYV